MPATWSEFKVIKNEFINQFDNDDDEETNGSLFLLISLKYNMMNNNIPNNIIKKKYITNVYNNSLKEE